MFAHIPIKPLKILRNFISKIKISTDVGVIDFLKKNILPDLNWHNTRSRSFVVPSVTRKLVVFIHHTFLF